MSLACSVAYLRANPMRGLGLIANLKAPYGLLQEAIGLRHPAVLPQVFDPGVGFKGLDETPVHRRILEYAPVIGAVATALARVAGERLQKRRAALRVNMVFGHHHHRPSVIFHG